MLGSALMRGLKWAPLPADVYSAAEQLAAQCAPEFPGLNIAPDEEPAPPDWFYRDWTARDVANWQRLAKEGHRQARGSAEQMLAGYAAFMKRKAEAPKSSEMEDPNSAYHHV